MGASIGLTELLAGGAYRPANWSQPQQYFLTCTLPSATVSSSSSVNGVVTPGSSSSVTSGSPTTYYFDAVMMADHAQEAVGTKHPVQIGSPLIDHVYLQPQRVVLQVKLSDAMQSFVQGQYSSVPSKSVSAYQTFLQIQAARVPITLATRLKTYQNMWLALVAAHDDVRTAHGFNGTLHFEQIISASVSTQTVSARPHATDSTNLGTLSTQPASAANIAAVNCRIAP
jgi:hypothetical protein